MNNKKLEKYYLLLEKKKRKIKKSYYEFVKYFWDVIVVDEFKDNWHIPYLCGVLQGVALKVINKEPMEYDVIIINISPGESKSTIASVMLLPWMWTLAPWVIHLSNSHSSELAMEHSQFSRDIIKSEKYKEMFKDVEIRRDIDNKSIWRNTAGGARIISSTGKDPIGKHAHIHTNDDGMSRKHSQSEAYRKTAIDHIASMATRKKDPENTPLIVIEQRLHNEDITGYLLEKDKRILHICIPGELSKDVKPKGLRKHYNNGLMDTSRLSRKVLKDKLVDLGSYGYAGQIMQSPSPSEGGIIKRNWIGTFRMNEVQGCQVHFVADTAFNKKKKGSDNDPCAIGAYCIKDNVAYLINYNRKWLEMHQVIKAIEKDVEDHGNIRMSIVGVEPKATGIPIVQELKRTTTVNVMEQHIPRIMGKEQDKTVRLYASSPKIQSGRFKVLEDAPWVEQFIGELCTFPNDRHDEAVDITNMIIEKMTNNSGDLRGSA